MPEKNTRSPQPAPPHDLILEGRARLTRPKVVQTNM